MINNNYEKAKTLIHDSDGFVIGAGSGLSAAGGLNYIDKNVFNKYYSNFKKFGFKTIWDGVSNFWECTKENCLQYWAFWATHINNIAYEAKVTKPYQKLYEFFKDKNYFVVTTNVDYQFYKASFDPDKIFAMQGQYRYFQCSVPCHNKVYYNYEMIQQMLKNIDYKTMTIRESDIPKCPKCGKMLIPNLRKDDLFVEEPNMINLPKYQDFLNQNKDKKLVFIELGIGFNSPGAIRIPFERLVGTNKNWMLIRVNKNDPELYYNIPNKAVIIQDDINHALDEILQ